MADKKRDARGGRGAKPTGKFVGLEQKIARRAMGEGDR